MTKVFKPVTIITEDWDGDTGIEEHESMTSEEIKVRCDQLETDGYGVVEVQVNEAQDTWRWE